MFGQTTYTYKNIIKILLYIYFGYFSALCLAEVSNTNDPLVIHLGMSTALSGPAQQLGLSMLKGVRKKIDEENHSAYWVKKNIKFQLNVLDDSYEAHVAEKNVQELISKNKVVAVIGNVGTPTAIKSWPVANNAGVVFYGAYTGSGDLRLNPPAPYVFNYRPSYDQEMSNIIEDILSQGISIKDIGLFLQNDDFGQAGLTSVDKALSEFCGDCSKELFKMHYEHNTLNIAKALEQFIQKKPKPQAVILVGTSEPSAEFIKFAYQISSNTRFYCLSFTGLSALKARLRNTPALVFMSQVIKPQSLADSGSVDESGEKPEPNKMDEIMLEGYFSTEFFFLALRKIKGSINSQSVREALLEAEAQVDKHGLIDHQILNNVWLVQLKQETESIAQAEQ